MKIRFLIIAGAILLGLTISASAQSQATPADLRRLAEEYYKWRNQQYPVASSDGGLHTWDHKLTDFSAAAIATRRARDINLLAQVNRIPATKWKKEDQIDWLLFRAQLEAPAFFDRVMDFEHSDPQVYVNECSNAIFSLIKKDYDSPRNPALSATARLKAMPAMIEQGKRNLPRPVKLYAQLAIESARSIDSLFKDSMMTALA